MGKRQEAALETRRSIVEAMRSLLEEKSGDSINIEEITTRAGVAKGSFYTYFRRKEDIISEVALEQYAKVKELVMNSSDGVFEQLSMYLKKSVEIIEKNTLPIAQQWMKSVVAPLDGELSGVSKYRYDSQNLSGILQRAVEQGELKKDTPVDVITDNIMNTYYGAVAVWCINKGESHGLMESIEGFCSCDLELVIRHYKT